MDKDGLESAWLLARYWKTASGQYSTQSLILSVTPASDPSVWPYAP
jgi:hypothetical protein